MDKTFDTLNQVKAWLISLHRKHAGVNIKISSDKDDNGNKIARIFIERKTYEANVDSAKKDIVKVLSDYGAEEYVVVDQNKTKCLILVPQDRDVDSIVFGMSCYVISGKKKKVDFCGFSDLKEFLKKNKIDFEVEYNDNGYVNIWVEKQAKTSIYNSLYFSWNPKGKFVEMSQP